MALALGACSEAPQGETSAAAEAPAVVAPDGPQDELAADEIEKIGEDDPRVSQIFDLGVGGDSAAEADQVLALALAQPALPAVQIEALSALEFLGKHVPNEAVAGCAKIMDAADQPIVRSLAAEALEFIGGRKATDVLLDHLGDDSADVRERVAEALELMVEPRDLARVRAAYEAEVDRGVKLALTELLENIELDRRRLAAEAGEAS